MNRDELALLLILAATFVIVNSPMMIVGLIEAWSNYRANRLR